MFRVWLARAIVAMNIGPAIVWEHLMLPRSGVCDPHQHHMQVQHAAQFSTAVSSSYMAFVATGMPSGLLMLAK